MELLLHRVGDLLSLLRREVQRSRFRLLVSGVKDYAIFMLDPTGRISSWNAGAEHVLEVGTGSGYQAAILARLAHDVVSVELIDALRIRAAQEAVIHFVGRHGERAMFDSVELRKACCNLRKMEPLARMMAARTAWVTGLRREQSNTRAVVPFSEIDAQGRTKFNPLADWSWNDVWHHIATNDVPYNPLHDEFMPSIGCAPCTRAIAVGEDFRAGRWWWEDEKAKECGLHVKEPAPEGAVSMIGDQP